MHRPASLVASILFFLMAVGQLCRAIVGIEVTVAGIEVPIWMSSVAFVVLATLAFWILKERRKPD